MSKMDKRIGERLKAQRHKLELTDAAIAAQLSISLIIYLKFENGSLRIPASMLVRMAEFLNVPLAYFFVGGCNESDSPPSLKQIEELVQAFRAIANNEVRQHAIKWLVMLSVPRYDSEPPSSIN